MCTSCRRAMNEIVEHIVEFPYGIRHAKHETIHMIRLCSTSADARPHECAISDVASQDPVLTSSQYMYVYTSICVYRYCTIYIYIYIQLYTHMDELWFDWAAAGVNELMLSVA